MQIIDEADFMRLIADAKDTLAQQSGGTVHEKAHL
jgi:hypothetical protein